MSFDELTNRLIIFSDKNDDTKSSHWKYYTKNFNSQLVNQSYGVAGFGTASKKNLIKIIYHYIFQRILFFKNNIFKTDNYNLMKSICNIQKRNLNLDSLRHVFTHNLLEKYISNTKNKICCCIGDGRTNYIAPLLLNKKFKKIISVNLSEILLADLQLLKYVIKSDEIIIIESENDYSRYINDDKTRLLLLPAKKCNILFNKNIDFFINIASFQEMKNSTVKLYFDIIKSNNSLFYCCNREYKELMGGEILEFDKYDWGNPKVFFKEYCPWHQLYYSIIPPFFFKYDGKIVHILVDYGEN